MTNFSIEDIFTKVIEYRSGARALAELTGAKIYTIQKHFSREGRKHKVYDDRLLVQVIDIKK